MKVADNLRSISNGLQLLQRSDFHQIVSILEIVRQQATLPGPSTSTTQRVPTMRQQPNFISANQDYSIGVSRGLSEEVRCTLTCMEILDLFSRILDTQILRRVPANLRTILLKRYLGDFVDRPSDSAPLGQLYLLCAEAGQDIPDRSALLQQGENEILHVILALRRLQADKEKGIDVDPQQETAERLLKRLELHPSLMALEYILGLFPILTRGDKLDQYLDILLSRLRYLEIEKKVASDKLALDKKLLEKEAETVKKEATNVYFC